MPYSLTTKQTWAQTIDDLAEVFRKWGIASWSVEPASPGRRAANWNQTLAERTVTLRYTHQGRQVTLAMRDQNRAVDNLRVLYLAVDAIRMNEVRGIAELVASAYAQLPGPGAPPATRAATTPSEDPYAVLSVERSASLDLIERIWKARLRAAHPDHGGSSEAAARLNAAMDAIRKERGG